MTVALIDLGFLDHEKLRAVEHDPRLWADCVALWFAALLYASRNTSRGVIFATRLVRIAHPMIATSARRAADGLVRCGLWESHEHGYRIHDFEEWRPLIEEWLTWLGRRSSETPDATDRDEHGALSDAARSRAYRLRKRHGAVTDGVTVPVTRHVTAVTNVTKAVTKRHVTAPSQTLPSDLPPISKESSEKEGRNNAEKKEHGEKDAREAVTGAVTVRDAETPGWLRLAMGYRERYEAQKQTVWMSWGAHERSFSEGAAWVEAQAAKEGRSFDAVGSQLLDGLFADEWATARDWPPKHLATKPGALYMAGRRFEPRSKTSPLDERARRRALAATRDARPA